MYLYESKYGKLLNLPMQSKNLLYLGGECDENHSKLTVGKEYSLHWCNYAKSKNDKRVKVLCCKNDTYYISGAIGKYCNVDIKNFGTFFELRDRKIEEVLK